MIIQNIIENYRVNEKCRKRRLGQRWAGANVEREKLGDRDRDRDGGSILGCIVAGSSRYWLRGLY